MAGIAIPAIGELLRALGLAALAALAGKELVEKLIERTRVSSKLKEWAVSNSERVGQDLDRKEPREETPFTAPELFEKPTGEFENGRKNTKSHRKKALGPSSATYNACPVGSIWDEDFQHCNQFEVYSHKDDQKRDKRFRVVSIDGRTLAGPALSKK